MEDYNKMSDLLQAVLIQLRRKVKSFSYDTTKTLVSLYAELPGAGAVSWAAMRRVKRADNPEIQILLRRFDPSNTTVNIGRNKYRINSQGWFVTVTSADDAVEMIIAHLNDMRNRVKAANKYGIRLFDNRTFNRSRDNRQAAH